MIRLFKIVLKNFVKKCFLKKYVEGYKSEVVIKVFFLMKCFIGFFILILIGILVYWLSVVLIWLYIYERYFEFE